jgi:hypothetical protein
MFIHNSPHPPRSMARRQMLFYLRDKFSVWSTSDFIQDTTKSKYKILVLKEPTLQNLVQKAVYNKFIISINYE